MGNSPTRTINYKPRYAQFEALELLPLPVKAALWDAVVSYDSNAMLREYRKHEKAVGPERATRVVINWIRMGDRAYMNRSWELEKRRVGQSGPKPQSPTAQLGMQPLRSFNHLTSI